MIQAPSGAVDGQQWCTSFPVKVAPVAPVLTLFTFGLPEAQVVARDGVTCCLQVAVLQRASPGGPSLF